MEEENETRLRREMPVRIVSPKKPEEVDLPISQCMGKGVIVLASKKSVVDAAKIMEKNRIGSVVVTEKGRAVGIVTERDIVRKIVARKKSYKTLLKNVMSSPLRTISKNSSVREAILAMKKYGIKRFPILDEKKRLIGIVTETDIARSFPGIMDLITEFSKIRTWEPGVETTGTCNKCGLWSETLTNVGGELICEECGEEEG